MKKILLDTNFLLIPAQFNVDIFAEIHRIMPSTYELYVLDKTIDELTHLSIDKKQKVNDRRAANLALQLIVAKKVNILKSSGNSYVDDLLVNSNGYIIATQDVILKRRLKAKNIKIITLRSKKILIFS